MNTLRLTTFYKNFPHIVRKTLCFAIFIFLLASCCDTGYHLVNDKKCYHDITCSTSDKNNCIATAISFVAKNRYTYEEKPNERRFIYEITISHNERNAVKLNAFELTNLDNTPIIAKYYVETYTKAATNTLPSGISYQEHLEAYKRDPLSTKIDKLTWELDSFPVLLRDSGEGKAHCIRIKAETNEPYSKIKGLKVRYDFEVGENRYISNNIEYKRRRYWDCRPKIW